MNQEIHNTEHLKKIIKFLKSQILFENENRNKITEYLSK